MDAGQRAVVTMWRGEGLCLTHRGQWEGNDTNLSGGPRSTDLSLRPVKEPNTSIEI